MHMTAATAGNWFDVDRDGLAKLLERRGGPGGGKISLIHELISNAWDAEGTTRVDVTPSAKVGVTLLLKSPTTH
jgi:hypothetical protein